MRFYHRTGPNSGYSNGLFFEALRSLWPIAVVLIFAGAIVGAVTGNAGSLFLASAMGLGAWWGWKHPKRR